MIQRTATFVIPKLSGYGKGVKNVISCQKPSGLSQITEKQAKQILDTLKKENTPVYDSLRGQINAMADQSGHRLNILFSETHPGMLEVTIAPKSAPTTREFFNELVRIFSDSKNAGKHAKNVKEMWQGASAVKQGETAITHVVDPKTDFIGQLRESLYKLIENAEFRKYAK